MTTDRLILASASPRRAELLKSVGLRFETHPASGEEPPTGRLAPREHVLHGATWKARAVASAHPGRVVLGADTVVATGDDPDAVLGKPRDDEEAAAMLRTLSGRTHVVWTGACLARVAREEDAIHEAARAACTRVTFRDLDEDLIARYVASGEPRDKAGAYAVQGLVATHVDHLDGSWSNVVGLPLEELPALFRELAERLADWQDW